MKGKFQFWREPISGPPIELDGALLYDLGFVETSDDKTLRVYEIHLREQTSIARRRAGLRKIVAKALDFSVEGALAGFYTNQEEQWRLSFLAKELVLSPQGDVTIRETAPTRYTYLLGPEVQTRTAQERLGKINKSMSLPDIEEVFSVEPLNQEFYKELVKWYKRARKQINFPGNVDASGADNSIDLIRLITRILFVWFLKEKKLVNGALFDFHKINEVIHYEKESSYYKAILQNLFFATLNSKKNNSETARNRAGSDGKILSSHYEYGKDSDNPLFKIEDSRVKSLFAGIPFLNGGLFECLDPPPPHIHAFL